MLSSRQKDRIFHQWVLEELSLNVFVGLGRKKVAARRTADPSAGFCVGEQVPHEFAWSVLAGLRPPTKHDDARKRQPVVIQATEDIFPGCVVRAGTNGVQLVGVNRRPNSSALHGCFELGIAGGASCSSRRGCVARHRAPPDRRRSTDGGPSRYAIDEATAYLERYLLNCWQLLRNSHLSQYFPAIVIFRLAAAGVYVLLLGIL